MHQVIYPTAVEWAAMSERERIAWQVNLERFLEAVAPKSACTGPWRGALKPTIRVKAPSRRLP